MTPKTSSALEVLFPAIGRIRAGGKKLGSGPFDLDLLHQSFGGFVGFQWLAILEEAAQRGDMHALANLLLLHKAEMGDFSDVARVRRFMDCLERADIAMSSYIIRTSAPHSSSVYVYPFNISRNHHKTPRSQKSVEELLSSGINAVGVRA